MRLSFVFSEMGIAIRRNLSMIISVVLVTFISLTFVGTAGLLQQQIGSMKTYWYDKAQVAIYLCTKTSPKEICPQGEASKDVQSTISQRLAASTLAPYIDKYYFENHQQAYKTFQKEFKDNSVAKYVTPAQLNETFWVNLKDPNQAPIIIESFNGLAGVEEVKDQRTYLDQIFSMLNIASLAALSIAGLMLFSAALLISTTIRLSAVMRRREIGIMRLVGASNFYIQLPFILEGVVAGVIGSLLSGAAIVGIVQFFVQGFLAKQLPFTTFVGLTDALALLPGLVLVGAGLAAIAAATAIRRYLRV
jgi:cell division transport system permease protein